MAFPAESNIKLLGKKRIKYASEEHEKNDDRTGSEVWCNSCQQYFGWEHFSKPSRRAVIGNCKKSISQQNRERRLSSGQSSNKKTGLDRIKYASEEHEKNDNRDGSVVWCNSCHKYFGWEHFHKPQGNSIIGECKISAKQRQVEYYEKFPEKRSSSAYARKTQDKKKVLATVENKKRYDAYQRKGPSIISKYGWVLSEHAKENNIEPWKDARQWARDLAKTDPELSKEIQEKVYSCGPWLRENYWKSDYDYYCGLKYRDPFAETTQRDIDCNRAQTVDARAIERPDSEKGYTPDNVVMMMSCLNILKGSSDKVPGIHEFKITAVILDGVRRMVHEPEKWSNLTNPDGEKLMLFGKDDDFINGLFKVMTDYVKEQPVFNEKGREWYVSELQKSEPQKESFVKRTITAVSGFLFFIGNLF